MQAEQDGGRESLRILLAEDEAVTRMAMRALLERAGHRVQAVEDGRAAVAMAADGGFDLILMDLGLPGLAGDDAVRAIRSQVGGHGAAPRILMLTAGAAPGGLARCTACGADGVLTKPLRIDALAAALRDLADAQSPLPGSPSDTGPSFDEGMIATMREMLPNARATELLGKTAAVLRQHEAALAAALRRGDIAAAGAMAHKIAGVSGQYGCLALQRSARALEAALESGAPDAAARVRDLNDRFEPALAFLSRCAAMR